MIAKESTVEVLRTEFISRKDIHLYLKSITFERCRQHKNIKAHIPLSVRVMMSSLMYLEKYHICERMTIKGKFVLLLL